ncbi:unnamed protein product [Phyllotreta striolata]|uniref:SURP motif domain-containing protein n=1 Tax=Phyllotreta striolata TaxID=444603 RepID=A0A9N9TT62_PHYSR|nr:unnamed protein product [Phyllotreta striolata]
MSFKKSVDSTFQSKISRNDRFAQMSQQEKLIEQKKREILAKLEAKDKVVKVENKPKPEPCTSKPPPKSIDSDAANSEIKNVFSNDGSFLEQFKQMKEVKKTDTKYKSFNKSKGRHEKLSNDERSKSDRWNSRRSPSPRDGQPKRQSRFDNKTPNFESKITINTCFSSNLMRAPHHEPPTFDVPSLNVNTQDVTGQPLLKNIIQQQILSDRPVISASPVLLSIPPPQLVQSSTLVLNSTAPASILTTVNIPPPCLPTVELASIPPPNPIQIQNIPQPEPLNATNIPQPAPIQVQNIPTPASLQLNKIPTPKPLDLLSIPTPVDEGLSSADFIKNIPPPNKSVPPPIIQDAQIVLPHGAAMSVPPTQNVLIHNLPPPNGMDAFAAVTLALPLAAAPAIPSLMAQPILPPPGLINVNVSCPPPMLPFVTQPPPQMLGAVPPPGFKEEATVFPTGTPEYEAMASLGRMVAECGDAFEDVVRQRKEQDPRLWFLLDRDSTAYKEYRRFVDNVKIELRCSKEIKQPKAEDIYEPEMALEDNDDREMRIDNQSEESSDRKRKRRSRWGDQDCGVAPPVMVFAGAPPPLPQLSIPPHTQNQTPVFLSKLTRTDPGLIQYAINTYGSTNLTEEDWKKTEDNYKVSLIYQDMLKKKAETERLKMAGKNKYEYDSDEEIDGGTWEHKKREKVHDVDAELGAGSHQARRRQAPHRRLPAARRAEEVHGEDERDEGGPDALPFGLQGVPDQGGQRGFQDAAEARVVRRRGSRNERDWDHRTDQ